MSTHIFSPRYATGCYIRYRSASKNLAHDAKQDEIEIVLYSNLPDLQMYFNESRSLFAAKAPS